jgi:hypothetical protein
MEVDEDQEIRASEEEHRNTDSEDGDRDGKENNFTHENSGGDDFAHENGAGDNFTCENDGDRGSQSQAGDKEEMDVDEDGGAHNTANREGKDGNSREGDVEQGLEVDEDVGAHNATDREDRGVDSVNKESGDGESANENDGDGGVTHKYDELGGVASKGKQKRPDDKESQRASVGIFKSTLTVNRKAEAALVEKVVAELAEEQDKKRKEKKAKRVELRQRVNMLRTEEPAGPKRKTVSESDGDELPDTAR